MAYHREFEEGTMFDDAEDFEEEDSQMAGLLNAAAINDDDATTTQGVPAPSQT